MHCSESGVTDHLAVDDAHAITLAREAVANLGLCGRSNASLTDACFEQPLYDASELHGIIPENARKPFDIRDIISRLVDGSRFHEFKKLYGNTIVTGFAKIAGQDVGIIGNNGVLFGESAKKATSFIQLCNQRQIPLVFLVNVTGYMVGTKAERSGIARMVQRWFALSHVPMSQSSLSSSEAVSVQVTTVCAVEPTALDSCGCGPMHVSVSWEASSSVSHGYRQQRQVQARRLERKDRKPVSARIRFGATLGRRYYPTTRHSQRARSGLERCQHRSMEKLATR